MKFGKIALAASAVSLAIAPVAGQAVAAERATAPVSGESEFAGGSTGLIVLFALAALGIGIFAADSDPVST